MDKVPKLGEITLNNTTKYSSQKARGKWGNLKILKIIVSGDFSGTERSVKLLSGVYLHRIKFYVCC